MQRRETLNVCGFDIVVVPTGAATVTVRAIVNAGSAHETGAWGAAHFLEHLFFKGTKKRPYEQMNRLIAAIGDSNAYTDRDKTVFYIETLGDHALRAFELLCELLFEPALDPEELDKERGVILEEWQSGQDDPGGFFWDGAFARVMPAPYSMPVIGTRESIEAMTIDHVVAFREANYTRENIAFAIVGDVSRLGRDDLIRILAKHTVPAGTANTMPTVLHRRSEGPRPLVERFEHASQQAFVSMWLPSIPELEDRERGYANGPLYNALGGGMHSLLFNRIREDLGLAYAVGSFEILMWGTASGVLYAMTSPKNAERCIDEMRAVLKLVADRGIDPGFLDIATSNYLFACARAENSPSGIAHLYVDRLFYLRSAMDVSQHGYQDVRAKLDVKRKELGKLCREQAAWAFEQEPTIVVMNG